MTVRFYRWLTTSSVVATVFFLAAASAVAGTVDRVRFSDRDGSARIVLDTSAPCEYEVTVFHEPERLAVNLRGTRASASLGPASVGRAGVERVRVNRLSWGTQIVVDLTGPVSHNDFSLPKSSSRPARVVIDIAPLTARRAATPQLDLSDPIPVPQIAAPVRTGPVVIAVDAGHGGKDSGAAGRYGLVEKKLTLDIAKRIVARINKESGYRAVLTRNDDTYLTLPRRNELAVEMKAEAFVSIHLNTAPNRSARGTEIYFVSPAGAEQSASAVLLDRGRAASAYGVDHSQDDLLHMLVDMSEQSVLARSEMLAEAILDAMSRRDLPPTRAVKQKSFSVLRTISMPSVLVEAGFISNSEDAGLIRSSDGREKIAAGIADGLLTYMRTHAPARAPHENRTVVHRVQSGETLWKISQRYGTSVTVLRENNRLGHGSVLRVGQELLVLREN